MNRNRFTKIAITTLVLILTQMIFGCQADQATPTNPPEQETEMQETESQKPNEIKSVPIGEITNITWQWAELIEQNPAAQSVVPDPENYTLTFWDDGTFGFKADCNSGNGSYTVESNQIEFGTMMTTLAMCPPDSLHDQYLALLGRISTFGIADEKLVFLLKDDAGEIRFANSGPTEKPEAPPEEKTIFVGPEKVECVGVGPMECYQVKEDPDGQWQLFYDQIEGFEWEPGYTYEIRVAIYQVENPPADASSLRYELVEVVNKVETPVGPENIEAYISIEKPKADAELDASKPIRVSGMGAGLFEGNVIVQILDAAGNELALQPTIIQSPEAGMGGEGPWEIEISISIETLTEGKIVAFSPSPQDGEGWIASDEVNVTFSPEMALDASLENTPWILRSFAQQEELNSLLAVFQVTANLTSEDNKLSGIAGCNNYFTSYEAEGSKLAISSPVGATRMMCPEPQMALESAYLAALENIASYEMANTTMEILDADGNSLLVFQVEPFSLSESFTREELANATYLNEFAPSGVAQLVNGIFQESVTALGVVVVLTNHAVFGDITGDGAEDAAVVLVSQTDGSGNFFDLALVRKQDKALTNMARIQLGNRVQIKSMHLENGEIVVDMLTQGPEDPMCCPTQYVSNRYKIEGSELVLITTEVIE